MNNLSIITPSLNCANTIRSTIQSILPLLNKGAEYILVDSYSEDSTVGLARDIGAKVIMVPKGNMYEAINKGIKASKGEIITYVNGDDILYADEVEKCYNVCLSKYDISYGNIDYIDEYGRFLFSRRVCQPSLIKFMVKYYSSVHQLGMMFRRTVFDDLNGFDTSYKYAADYDFIVRSAYSGKKFFYNNAQTVGAFRLSKSQLSSKYAKEMAPEGIAIRNKLRTKYKSHKLGAVLSTIYRRGRNIDNILKSQGIHRIVK